MTTQPIPTPANPTLIPAWITSWEAFIKAHHTFLIVALTAGFLFFAVEKGITAYDRHMERVDGTAAIAAANAAKNAEAQSQTDKTNNAQLAAQLATIKAEADLNKAMLEGQLKLLQTKTKAQIDVDKTLPTPDLADRWSAILKYPPQAEISAANNAIIVTPKAALDTVVALENIPVYQKQLETTQAELIDSQKEYNAQSALVLNLNKTVADDQIALTAEKASHQADVKQLKLDVTEAKRHGFWKGFKWGFVAGVVTSIAVVVH